MLESLPDRRQQLVEGDVSQRIFGVDQAVDQVIRRSPKRFGSLLGDPESLVIELNCVSWHVNILSDSRPARTHPLITCCNAMKVSPVGRSESVTCWLRVNGS